MTPNADCRDHNVRLSQPSRLEALRSRLIGVTPDSTRPPDHFRVSEHIQDDNGSEVRDDWDSSVEEGNQRRHGKVAEGSDDDSDGMEIDSLDICRLLEE